MITGMSRYPELGDEAWLRAHYVDERMRADDVAELVGCSQNTVLRALREHGIEVRGRGSHNGDRQRLAAWGRLEEPSRRRIADEGWMRATYVHRRMSGPQIAALLGCTDGLVISALRYHGIPVRSSMLEAQRARFGIDERSRERLDDAKWLGEAYVAQGRSTVDIGRELGVGSGTVVEALSRHGVARRSTRDAMRASSRALGNGYDAQRRKRLQSLARDAGEVGKAYTQVIRILGALDRVPHTGRESSRLEGEAMDGLYRAEAALAQRLLLGDE